MNYPVLRLKAGRERSVLHRHPWIFSGAIAQPPEADNGQIVEVQDAHSNRLGYGFYSTKSQIACRMFHFGSRALSIDDKFWRQKVAAAYALRQRFIDFTHTNAYRLLHAEGDELPGVIIDVYDRVAVIQLLIRGVEALLPLLSEALASHGIEYIYLNTKDVAQRIEQVSLPKGWYGRKPSNQLIQIRENGILFLVDVEQGQKTGFFLDQRDNRQLLRQYSMGKNVLNTFCYTGGFSVYALAGGAQHVDSVDVSKSVLTVAAQNVACNGFSAQHHSLYAKDAFDFLEQQVPNAYYDIIVLDPPAFAKNARAVPNAVRGYKALNMLAIRRVKPGGLVFTFSCSGNIDRELFRKVVFGAASDVRRCVRILHQLSQPLDHPINIYHPEGEYLKGLVLYVE